MEKPTVMDFIFIQMDLTTMVSSRMEFSMERESSSTRLIKWFMKANGKTVNHTEREFKFSQVLENTKVISSTVSSTEKAR